MDNSAQAWSYHRPGNGDSQYFHIAKSVCRKCPYACYDAAQNDPSQKRLVISEPVWNEHDGAPSDDEVQRIVYRSEPAWSEHTYDGDPRYDERPLHTEQHYSKHIFPVHKVHRSKCSAYQQIYRGIVKSSPDTLDC